LQKAARQGACFCPISDVEIAKNNVLTQKSEAFAKWSICHLKLSDPWRFYVLAFFPAKSHDWAA